MPQTPERKRQYYLERKAVNGDHMRAVQAVWRDQNRETLRKKHALRREKSRAKCLVAAARVRARKSGVPFTLTDADVARLQSTIDAGRCEISGVAFTLKGPRSATSPSLDRRVPALGYVPENVRVVCHALNAGMGDWGEDDLLRVVRAWVASL